MTEKRKILRRVLGAIFLFASLASWFVLQRAVVVENSSTWGLPTLAFSLMFILLILCVTLFKGILELELLLASGFLSSLIFAFEFVHGGFILLGLLFIFSGIRRIRRDLELNLKIDLAKSIKLGKNWIIIGLAIVITSQYFFSLKNFDGQKNPPNFDLNPMMNRITMPVLQMMNPDLGKINKGENQKVLTVDEFILENYRKQNDEALSDQEMLKSVPLAEELSIEQQQLILQQANQQMLVTKNAMEKQALAEGRKQLGELVGKNLQGDEKISEVFASMANKKINDYFNTMRAQSQESSVLPMIMAMMLFFTVWPLGSTISIALVWLLLLIFKILKKTQLVEINLITVQKEVLD